MNPGVLAAARSQAFFTAFIKYLLFMQRVIFYSNKIIFVSLPPEEGKSPILCYFAFALD
jgi:hypothetical protein